MMDKRGFMAILLYPGHNMQLPPLRIECHAQRSSKEHIKSLHLPWHGTIPCTTHHSQILQSPVYMYVLAFREIDASQSSLKLPVGTVSPCIYLQYITTKTAKQGDARRTRRPGTIQEPASMVHIHPPTPYAPLLAIQQLQPISRIEQSPPLGPLVQLDVVRALVSKNSVTLLVQAEET